MGQKVKYLPPSGIFVDSHIFVVWTLAFKNLVDGWKIDAGCGHNKLVSLATHAILNEGLQCIMVSYLGYICI